MFMRKWDAQSIIDRILSCHGREPLNSSYFASKHAAVYAAAERIFGSWREAIEACGLDYSRIRKYQRWSRDRIVHEIIRMANEGISLNSNDVQMRNKPLYMAAVRRFKGWEDAVTCAGIDYGRVRLRRKMTHSDIRNEILRLYRSGVDLAYPSMRRHHNYLLASGMRKLGKGSWCAARKKCGIHDNYRLYRQRSNSDALMKEVV